MSMRKVTIKTANAEGKLFNKSFDKITNTATVGDSAYLDFAKSATKFLDGRTLQKLSVMEYTTRDIDVA